MMQQHTLRDAFRFEGVGLHSGRQARVAVVPAAPDSGLRFSLAGGTSFPAHAEYVLDTRRATVLGRDGQTVSTVEHLLAALFALGIDNAEIEVSGPEIPILDGSAATFVEAIRSAGTAPQPATRNRYECREPAVFRDGDALLAVLPAEHDEFRIRFSVDFPQPIGTHFLDAVAGDEYFAQALAAARTFVRLEDVEALRAAGLAQGGSLENALVFDAQGPMTPLRWPNEVVRHKTLDLIGDFALLGAWPRCEVIAIKSGHRLHATAVRALRARAGLCS